MICTASALSTPARKRSQPRMLSSVRSVDVNGKRFLTAVVAGYEVGCRVGMTGGASQLRRGFHPSATSGTFAAGAAAAKMLRLNPRQNAPCVGHRRHSSRRAHGCPARFDGEADAPRPLRSGGSLWRAARGQRIYRHRGYSRSALRRLLLDLLRQSQSVAPDPRIWANASRLSTSAANLIPAAAAITPPSMRSRKFSTITRRCAPRTWTRSAFAPPAPPSSTSVGPTSPRA